MDPGSETYLLLLLADGNLPTGSFVASSGLESYIKHGFYPPGVWNFPAQANEASIEFVRNSLKNHARSALPFVSDAHIAISGYRTYLKFKNSKNQDEAGVVGRIIALDSLYEAMTISSVTRRASKAQGVAHLTLFSKGFSKPVLPPEFPTTSVPWTSTPSNNSLLDEATIMENFIYRFKTLIRQGKCHGHLPICWGILTAALDLSLERSQYLHLFLYARSLLSASVRLNAIGPYASQQILLHVVRQMVDEELLLCKDLRTGLQPISDQQSNEVDGEVTDEFNGPATTWPLGEIIAARHDLQHSRVFNS